MTIAACIRRDLRTATSYRFAYVLELASVAFALILFYYLAQIVDSSALPSTDLGQGYFGFVAVGLALARVLQAGLSSFSRQLREDQLTGTFETLVATPVSSWGLILGTGAYELIRGALVAIVMLGLAVAFFGLRLEAGVESAVVAGAVLIACVVLFAALGVLLAAFTVVFKQPSGLLTMAVAGIGLLGGVYFPIELLPGALQALGSALPFTWGLDLLRGTLLSGETDFARLWYLIAFDLAALPAALLVFDVSLRRAKRTGSLAEY